MSGIIVLAVFFIATASSIGLIIKAYTQSIRSMEEIFQQNLLRERSSMVIEEAYINATENQLYLKLRNSGSLDVWNLKSIDFIIVYWDYSLGSLSSKILVYNLDWNVIGVILPNGTLIQFKGYIPPGQTALVEASLPSGLDYTKDVRIDLANQYGYVASYEIAGGG